MVQLRHQLPHRMSFFVVEQWMEKSLSFAANACGLELDTEIGLVSFDAQERFQVGENSCPFMAHVGQAIVRRAMILGIRMAQVNLPAECCDEEFQDWSVLDSDADTQAIERLILHGLPAVAVDTDASFTIEDTCQIGQHVRVCRNMHVFHHFTDSTDTTSPTFGPLNVKDRLVVKQGQNLTCHVASMKNWGENGESLSATVCAQPVYIV